MSSPSSRTEPGTGCGTRPTSASPSVLGLPHDFVTDRYAIIRHGGGGAGTTLVCGAVRFDHPAARSLVELLPATIHLTGAGSGGRVGAGHPADDGRRGRPAAARRRDRAHPAGRRAGHPGHPGLAGGGSAAAARAGSARCATAQIGRALALVHRDPARDWTVGDAGRRVRDVALGVRRPVLRAGRRTGHAVRDPVADADRAARAGRRATAPWPSWPAGWATGPRRRSAGRSSGSSASRRGRPASRPARRGASLRTRRLPREQVAPGPVETRPAAPGCDERSPSHARPATVGEPPLVARWGAVVPFRAGRTCTSARGSLTSDADQ